MKRRRHKAIIELVRTGQIASQEDLLQGLLARKIEVSQSTLSRDIQELRLAKAGGIYTLVEQERAPLKDESLRRILREFVLEIAAVQSLVIVKTGTGNASTVSQALDDAGWPEVAGSIAGDNTIFIAVSSNKEARRVEIKIRDLLT
jgi:transcriptional regulator of arginine metabolism